MMSNRSVPTATVIPVLVYPDVRAAVAWFTGAFGFVERVRVGEDHRSQLRIGVDGAMIVEAARLGHTDHKSALQELLQSRGAPPGSYHIISESGPDHEKTFCVEVRISGGDVTAVGTGKTKKEAEQAAAVAALIQLGAEGI